MSDDIKHECGLAFIRLRKPFSYYLQKYGSVTYGLNKLYLLMAKQHNRGRDGAGIASVKLNIEAGNPYLHRMRSSAPQPIADLFYTIGQEIQELEKHQPDIKNHPGLMKGHLPFLGELLLGHLRYGTQGKNNVEFCHPFIKRNISPGKNLALAGNFNLVNTDDLFAQINFEPGTFQKQSDLAAMMEVVHHFLVKEDDKNPNAANIANILKNATPMFDGGYTIGGLLGNGSSFVMRDAHGIRPAYYYVSEDVIVAASERAAIRTTFNVGENEVQELMPGTAIIVDPNGEYHIKQILEPKERRACSFERIYFSRGSDADIYKERKKLGQLLTNRILDCVNHDLENTVFSYIPNTAEVAFYGLVEGLHNYNKNKQREALIHSRNNLTNEELDRILKISPRVEKLAIKDVKMRTFITQDADRSDMVAHVYDTTYGLVRRDIDTIVALDDSIVRGTTLKQSILRIFDRLGPVKIIIVSSAPQIRYPDCYGIDMSRMGEFVAFDAAIQLLKERGMAHVIDDVYAKCLAQADVPKEEVINHVKEIYAPFSPEEISEKIAAIIRPKEISAKVEVIYQSLESLHDACPNHLGDWYFSGNYPTPGGNKVVNRAFMNWKEGNNERAYL